MQREEENSGQDQKMLLSAIRADKFQSAWMAQSVKGPTSAQVMISRFVGWSPASVQSQLGVLSLPLSLSAPPPLTLSLSLKINNKIK